MDTASPQLSIVVAVYNEDPRNLGKLLQRVEAALRPVGVSYEVVFVDDGSKAVTQQALRKFAGDHDHVKLVVLSRNFGQQAAISAGIDHSLGDAVVNIDSDCQDPPEMIPPMIEQWRKGYDVVYAQRVARSDRIGKRFFAHLFYRLLSSISSVSIPQDTGDFRLIDRKVVNALKALPEKRRFLRGLIPWLGFRQIGIPIQRDSREIGTSSYTIRKLVQLAADGILSFSYVPLYAVLIVGGVLLCASSVACAVWALSSVGIMHVHFNISNAGLLMAILMLAGVQLICTGVAVLYMSKILDEARGRPTYIVTERIGFGESDEGKRMWF